MDQNDLYGIGYQVQINSDNSFEGSDNIYDKIYEMGGSTSFLINSKNVLFLNSLYLETSLPNINLRNNQFIIKNITGNHHYEMTIPVGSYDIHAYKEILQTLIHPHINDIAVTVENDQRSIKIHSPTSVIKFVENCTHFKYSKHFGLFQTAQDNILYIHNMKMFYSRVLKVYMTINGSQFTGTTSKINNKYEDNALFAIPLTGPTNSISDVSFVYKKISKPMYSELQSIGIQIKDEYNNVIDSTVHPTPYRDLFMADFTLLSSQ